MNINLKTLNTRVLWAFPIAIAVTFFFYTLYAKSSWWMFFCCLFAFLIQFVCAILCSNANNIKINTKRHDYETQLNQYYIICKRYKKLFLFGYIVMILFDTFPFLAMNESFCAIFQIPRYEGGILVLFMVLAVIGMWSSLLIDILQKNIKKDFNKAYAQLSKDKRFEEKQKIRLRQIKATYGEEAIIIGTDLIISKEKQCIRLYDTDYKFEDILGCSLIDDATNKTITTSIGNTKTSTGSMVGRAVVGGILTGGLGAVAGATTAKKNISIDSASKTVTTHQYTIYVNINSLENPTIIIRVGKDSQMAHKIVHILNIIIERTKKS